MIGEQVQANDIISYTAWLINTSVPAAQVAGWVESQNVGNNVMQLVGSTSDSFSLSIQSKIDRNSLSDLQSDLDGTVNSSGLATLARSNIAIVQRASQQTTNPPRPPIGQPTTSPQATQGSPAAQLAQAFGISEQALWIGLIAVGLILALKK